MYKWVKITLGEINVVIPLPKDSFVKEFQVRNQQKPKDHVQEDDTDIRGFKMISLCPLKTTVYNIGCDLIE